MKQMTFSSDSEISLTQDSKILIPDNSTLTLIIKSNSNSSLNLEIGKNCNVSTVILGLTDLSLNQDNFVGENSTLHSYGIWKKSATYKITNHLVGKNSSAYDLHVFSESQNNSLKINSILRHANANTKGNISVRGVADDNSRITLDGMIKIEKNGSGAESFLTQNVILLSPSSHATANPELEIENNDVSSRHAASVSQIDQDKIFYLMSRGISQNDARKLIVDGFLEAVIEKISDEKVRKLFSFQ